MVGSFGFEFGLDRSRKWKWIVNRTGFRIETRIVTVAASSNANAHGGKARADAIAKDFYCGNANDGDDGATEILNAHANEIEDGPQQKAKVASYLSQALVRATAHAIRDAAGAAP